MTGHEQSGLVDVLRRQVIASSSCARAVAVSSSESSFPKLYPSRFFF